MDGAAPDTAGVPPAAPPRALLVDGGQTGTRLAVLEGEDARPRIIAEGSGIAPLAPLDGPEQVARDLAELCRNAGVELEGITTVAAGLTGLGEVWSRRSELCDQLYTHLALAEVVVASDVVTSHLGALAGMPGVVAAIGTGSVVLGLDGGGRAVKVDGWGHLLGDAGSGFAIGRSGLRAALEHHDGRGGSARLASAAEARFGPLEELSGAILADPARVRRVASFAPDVADAARAGDALASRIWADAATSVAAAILAAMRRLGPGEASRTVSWAGSLLEVEDLMRSPVRQRVTAEVGDDVDWSAPAGTAIDGAAALLWSEVRARAGDLVHRATWTD